MVTIQRVGPPRFEQGDGRLLIHFKLNRPPDVAWVRFFKTQNLSAPLTGAKVVVDRRGLTVEVPRGSKLSELVTALDCFIECANLLSPETRSRSTPRSVPAGG